MDILNKIGKNVSNTYKYTAEKTGKIAKETKLKFKISENKSKIMDIYEKIGQKVYEKHIREENIDIKVDLAEDCAEIDFLSNEIEEARKEILNLKDKKQCKKCFYEMEINYNFCPECGKKQNDEQQTRQEVVIDNLENSNIPYNKEQEAQDVIDRLDNNSDEIEDSNL